MLVATTQPEPTMRPTRMYCGEGDQPLHERQPTIQLLRVVGYIGESERRVPVSAQRRITAKLTCQDHRITPTLKSNKPLGYLAVNKIAKKAITTCGADAPSRAVARMPGAFQAESLGHAAQSCLQR